jgi:hypothetical protein
MDALAGSLALLLPDPFHCETTELNCFRRSSCSSSNSLFGGWSMPQIGKDGNAFEKGLAGTDNMIEVILHRV